GGESMSTTCRVVVPVLASIWMATVVMSRLAFGSVGRGRSGWGALCSSATGCVGTSSVANWIGFVKSTYALRFVSQLTGPSNCTEQGLLGQSAQGACWLTSQPGTTFGVRAVTESWILARWSMLRAIGTTGF